MEARSTYTDNFFYSPRDTDLTEAWGFLLMPGAGFRGGNQYLNVSAKVGGEVGLFDVESNLADYEDYQAMLTGEWTLAERHRLIYAGEYRQDHTPFGTERTEGAILDPQLQRLDEWRQPSHSLTYRIGAPADRFNLDLRAAHQDRTYTTNRSITRYLDYSTTGGEATLLYNYSPKTALFANVSTAKIEFDEIVPLPAAIDKNADEMAYRLGMRWAATAKTSGEFAVGYLNRKPDDSSRDDFNALDWTARVIYQPVVRRKFELTSARTSQESFQAHVEFINNQYFALEWTEYWTPRLATALAASYLDAEFVGTDRKDNVVAAILEARYQLSMSLHLIGRAGSTVRESRNTSVDLDYDRFTGYIGIRYSN